MSRMSSPVVTLIASASLMALTVQAVITRSIGFSRARFVGNTTAASLAYRGTVLGVFEGRSGLRCGAICAADIACESFNLAKSGTGGTLRTRCETLATVNEVWDPAKFVAPANETSSFYINIDYLQPSYFKLIPAVYLGPNSPTTFPWRTDCMNQNGTAGFMVAFRNNRTDTSEYTTDHKCRIFRHSFVFSSETPRTVHWNSRPDYNMKCPNGTVITAVYDLEIGCPGANTVRCQKPALPWAVNNTECRVISILKRPGDANPASVTNDPGLTGTADSIWGAQCGSASVYEALVAIKLTWDLYNEKVECCPLYTVSP